ncbi:MAG TPA: hypothetical protein VM684_20400 [Gaiellales bacterium]|nr:hypothetical protein [Gaiellales bacterium]
MAGRISDWDERLASEGRVTFRQNPWVPLLLLLVCLLFTAGFVDAVVEDGASFWVVVGLVVFGVAGIPLTLRALVAARPALTVTADGVRTRRGPLIPFENIVAVTTRGRSLTLDYVPLPDERLVMRQKKTGLKQQYAPLAPLSGAPAGDVAYWLLQCKGGPDARIEISGEGGRFAQVYQLAEKRFWER